MKRRVILFLSVLLCAIPSAFWIAPVSADDDPCRSQILFLIDNVGLDASKSAPSFGCRQDGGGRWYMGQISLLSNPDAFDGLNSSGQLILAAVDRLSTDDAFGSSIRFDRTTSTVYFPGRGGVVDTSNFSSQWIGGGPNWLNNIRSEYNDSTALYLTRTVGDEAPLVEYMQWFMARRDLALTSMTIGMDPLSGPSFQSAWGYQQFPWPWQLADPASIASFTGEFAIKSQPNLDNPAPSSGTIGDLRIDPTNPVAVPGDTIAISLSYSRLQGISDVAFMVYAERMTVTNLPLSQVDRDGDFACSPGHEGDTVSPFQRATDLAANPGFLPSYLELQVPDTVIPGDRLAVCVELIGFAGDREMFTWNTRVDVQIVGE